jgi:hypothetical protein
MSSFVGWMKRTARATGYLFNQRNHVEAYMLEATCNDKGTPRKMEMMTAARLSFEEVPYAVMKEVLFSRLTQIRKPHSVRKAIILLDYALRFGNETVRHDIVEIQSVLELLSVKESCPVIGMPHDTLTMTQDLLVLVNSDDMYNAVRERNEQERVKIEQLPIRIKGRLAETVGDLGRLGMRRSYDPGARPFRIDEGFPVFGRRVDEEDSLPLIGFELDELGDVGGSASFQNRLRVTRSATAD